MNASRTLEQLEAHPWGEPPSDSSPMVVRCHALRKVPLSMLSAGDCRMLLTQGIGTTYVLPIAVAFVEQDPLVEGDYYTGDLLTALLRLTPEEWTGHEKDRRRLISAARRADDLLAATSDGVDVDVRLARDIRAALHAFGA
jgi:hypothetical protein